MTHTAVYGQVKMKRAKCSRCKGWSLIVDNQLLCCGQAVDKAKGFKVMIPPRKKRRKPSKKLQKKILEKQENKCLYCSREFSIPYWYKNKVHYTKLCWDHLVPFSYSRRNKSNWVAACNICNNIKGSKMFDTVEDLFYYIEHRRSKKGYEYYEDLTKYPALEHKDAS